MPKSSSRNRRRALVGAIALAAMLGALAGLLATVGGPPPPRPVGGAAGPWNLVFDSEFNGSSLDTSQWSTGFFGSGITQPDNSFEQECYDPAQVSVANGALELTAIAKAENCGGVTRPYASGIVTTYGKFSFTYGYLEARIFLPGSTDIADWPAFWAVGQNWPTDGEIDVLEGLGGQACAHFHNSAGQRGLCLGGSFTGAWHIFAANWQPGSITYYYDGTKIWHDTSGITSSPMYLLVDLALDGSPSNTVPARMKVAYVRVWQH
ncbi:MAG: glycoside hydrolase family 16 protein [Acidimicrobiales bacterium]